MWSKKKKQKKNVKADFFEHTEPLIISNVVPIIHDWLNFPLKSMTSTMLAYCDSRSTPNNWSSLSNFQMYMFVRNKSNVAVLLGFEMKVNRH